MHLTNELVGEGALLDLHVQLLADSLKGKDNLFCIETDT